MLVLGVYGPSGSGKTHVISSICDALSSEYKIAVVKHSPHHDQLDVPGKDSDLHIKAGAGASLVSGDGVSLLSLGDALSLEECLQFFRFTGRWDLLFVEGFTGASIPWIKVGDGPEQKGTLLVHEDEGRTIAFIKERLGSADKPSSVELEVGGRRVPLGGFPQSLIANTLDGLVSSFKGGEEGDIRVLVRR